MGSALFTIVLNIIAWAIIIPLLNRRISRAQRMPEVLERMRAEVQGVIVEMNQTTERNVELLEDRIAQIGELLAQADRRLGVLKREAEKQDSAAQVYSQLGRQKSVPASPNGEEKRESLREKVLDLYRKGIAPSLIANRLGTTIGEVELIITLRDGNAEPAE